jgi:hypothetical protein
MERPQSRPQPATKATPEAGSINESEAPNGLALYALSTSDTISPPGASTRYTSPAIVTASSRR